MPPDQSAPTNLMLALAYRQSDFKKLPEQKPGPKITNEQ